MQLIFKKKRKKNLNDLKIKKKPKKYQRLFPNATLLANNSVERM